MKALWSFLKDEEGQALSEYGLVLGLIAIVAIVAIAAFGNAIKDVFQNLVNSITGKTTTTTPPTTTP